VCEAGSSDKEGTLSGARLANVAAALDFVDWLLDRVDSYPVWTKVFFLVTLVLVLASIMVYVVLYGDAERRRLEREHRAPRQ
jgi:hypothetical protein